MSKSTNTRDRSSDSTDLHCAICNAALTAGGSYVIRIDIFADADLPASDKAEAASDIQASLTEVISELNSMNADDVQNRVHRRFEYQICPRCQPKLLANPLGLPRVSRPAAN